MTITRSVHDEVQNVLDYLKEAELALYCNPVSMREWQDSSSVGWHSFAPEAAFLISREHGTVEQYEDWLANGQYSAVLFDASLLQIQYQIGYGSIVAHRLAHIPCPFNVDKTYLDEGWPVADVVSLYTDISDVVLRSPIRFDFDLKTAGLMHPAAHMTINSSNCRIACVAPMHVHRFVDFVFRHFYPPLWQAHIRFFEPAAWRHVGEPTIEADEREGLHLNWNVHAQRAS